MKLVALTLIAVAGLLTAGCPQPATVVTFTNDAEADVRLTVYYSDEQNIPEELLEEIGETVEMELSPGETQSFSRDCDRIQAVLVKGELRLLGGIGPEETSRVYRDGDDFGCGDALQFTFTQSALGTDLDITFSRR